MRRATWLAGLAVTAALAVAACSSSGSPATGPSMVSSANAAAMQNPNLDTGTSLGNKPAPEVNLVNQFGQPMSLSQFHGRVVMLSFEDSECTTVCPLTTQSMVLAKELLGKAGSSVQLLGVDANPDAIKVSDVMAYSRVHGMINQWDFLTGSLVQLKSVWKAYNVAVQIEAGQIDHTPALYVIDQQGRLQKALPDPDGVLERHPVRAGPRHRGCQPAAQPPEAVKFGVTGRHSRADPFRHGLAARCRPGRRRSSPASDGTVTLGPGKARLVVFFATWLTETSDLNSELTSLNAYAKAAASKHLPALTAVDETATEPSAASVTAYLRQLGPLSYPVALDQTGRVADGYGVQDQPWLVLVNKSGKITWQHDGWVSLASLEKAAAADQ